MPESVMCRARSVAVALVAALPGYVLADGARAASEAEMEATASWVNSLALEQLGDVIVTAQRREENLQNVPIAVTVFTGDQLARRADRDFQDLSGRVPNFIVAPMPFTGDGALIWLRGFGTLNPEKTNDPPVNVYVDGVYLGTNTGQMLRLFDIERMEVLRGVQGTLFGKNATGGAINITRTRPGGDHVSGKLAVTVGSFGRNDYRAVINAPVVKDKLWVKVAGLSENDAGYMKNAANPDYRGGRDYKSGNITLVAEPSDKLEFGLLYDHVDDRSQPIPFVQGFTATALALPVTTPTGNLSIGPYIPCVRFNFCAMPTDVNQANSNGPAFQKYILNALTADVTYHLEGIDLLSITGWRASKDDTLADADATPVTSFTTHRLADYSQFTQEFRAVSRNQGRFNYVAGAYFYNAQFHSAQDVARDAAYSSATLAPGTVTFSGFRPQQFTRSWALYAQADYKVLDALKVTVGGRYSHDYKKFALRLFQFSDQYFGGAVPTSSTFTGQYRAGTFTPRVSLDYRFSPQVMAYFSFSRGYNGGGFNPGGSNAFNIGPYGAEHINDFEAGLKTNLLGEKLRINVNGFHILYSGKQLSVVTVDPIVGASSQIRNVGDETIDGLTLDMEAVPARNWRVAGSASYMRARYTRFLAQIQTGQPVTDNTTLTPVRSPKFTANGEVAYTFPAASGDITLAVAGRYQSRYQLDAVNSPQGWTGPGATIDLSAAYDFTHGKMSWQVAAFVKNLGDRIYPIQLTQAGTFLDEKVPAEGRTFGVSLQTAF